MDNTTQAILEALKTTGPGGTTTFNLDRFIRQEKKVPLPFSFRMSDTLKVLRDQQLIVEKNNRWYHPSFAG